MSLFATFSFYPLEALLYVDVLIDTLIYCVVAWLFGLVQTHPHVVHMIMFYFFWLLSLMTSHICNLALSVLVSDNLHRQSPPARLASLSTVSSAKRVIAGSTSSRHMRGAMTISIRRYVSLSHLVDSDGWSMRASAC